MDWGPVGARVAGAEVAVVVDVLSFSTSVCVAVERGMRVFPYRWRGPDAEAFAREHDAVLAVGRLEATRDGGVPAPSLSPAGLLECEVRPRLVLPSPNGSTIADALRRTGAEVAVGCLRNARAVAEWLMPRIEAGRSGRSGSRPLRRRPGRPRCAPGGVRGRPGAREQGLRGGRGGGRSPRHLPCRPGAGRRVVRSGRVAER
nr:2-phosphosulfolactate phosphatase [Nocardioides sp. zg-DK7169]